MDNKKNSKKWVVLLITAMSLFIPPVIQPKAAPADQQNVMVAQAERHPAMDRALKALVVARRALKAGAHDFGGHRVKALELTDQAILEVKAALAYDKQ